MENCDKDSPNLIIEVGGKMVMSQIPPTKSFFGSKFILEPISGEKKAKKFDPGDPTSQNPRWRLILGQKSKKAKYLES